MRADANVILLNGRFVRVGPVEPMELTVELTEMLDKAIDEAILGLSFTPEELAEGA